MNWRITASPCPCNDRWVVAKNGRVVYRRVDYVAEEGHFANCRLKLNDYQEASYR
ncbi:hypothetical protein M8C21_023031 [Ambrosia artemisiifolia]|uniref:Uncharacterized protein n=1 Tax=Ambrosia artemisiifolia TaxID=4212 RepID=A0AAD5D6Z1_AMBAR|nr:hypothetical protein M8C21_023031 [Ambrosia artemisiifolia]